jgi:hypothetical protein
MTCHRWTRARLEHLLTAEHPCLKAAAMSLKTAEHKENMGEQKEIFKEMQIVERFERRLTHLEEALAIAVDRIRRLELARLVRAQPPVDAISDK